MPFLDATGDIRPNSGADPRGGRESVEFWRLKARRGRGHEEEGQLDESADRDAAYRFVYCIDLHGSVRVSKVLDLGFQMMKLSPTMLVLTQTNGHCVDGDPF